MPRRDESGATAVTHSGTQDSPKPCPGACSLAANGRIDSEVSRGPAALPDPRTSGTDRRRDRAARGFRVRRKRAVLAESAVCLLDPQRRCREQAVQRVEAEDVDDAGRLVDRTRPSTRDELPARDCFATNAITPATMAGRLLSTGSSRAPAASGAIAPARTRSRRRRCGDDRIDPRHGWQRRSPRRRATRGCTPREDYRIGDSVDVS